MGDDVIDTAKLSLRINIPTLVSIVATGVIGYAAWSQTNVKAEEALGVTTKQEVVIKDMRSDINKIDAKTDVLTERSAQQGKALDRIEQTLHEIQRRNR